MYLAVGLAYD
ncbi:hypothetical protein SS209_02480 [Salmonella enterica subsp. enterica serovar Senftenberg str. SS209]|nr:hypothetical protein SS209_02480 [Salmonella enterica subsp. enterica serovar Senftenberg str. SS209]